MLLFWSKTGKMNNVIQRFYWRFILKPYYQSILGQLGNKSIIPPSTKLDKPNNIYIGNRVSIGRMAWLAANPLTGKSTCSLSVGDGVYLGNFAHIYCTSKIEIGKNVLIADRIYITDNLHSYTDINTPIINQPIIQIAEVYIGDGAWIGENVCIIGANVGKQSVVGSNSVLTKSIPDYCVAVGSPAKIIKRYSFQKNEWLRTDENGNFIEK